MVALFPVPAWSAKLMNGVQKKKMEAVSPRWYSILIYIDHFHRLMLAYKASPRVCTGFSMGDAMLTLAVLVMNVLRMIKLFGWEKKMGDKIANKREEELLWIKRRNFLDLLNQVIKYAFCAMMHWIVILTDIGSFVIPIVIMIVTYAT